MNKRKVFSSLVLVLLTCLPAGLRAESHVVSDPVVFAEQASTTYYRAVFGQYLTVIPDTDPADGNQSVDCGISISNLCAAPDAVLPLMAAQGGPASGRLTLVLYGAEGDVIVYTPDSDDVGQGLEPDGTLSEGRTWRVLLSQILVDHFGSSDPSKLTFSGYGWVLSQFDCLGGTYNNTVFGVGFTQAFEFLPAMGQGGWFGGLPVFGLNGENFLEQVEGLSLP